MADEGGGSSRAGTWTALAALVALLSATASMIGNLGGARDTICSIRAAHDACLNSGLISATPPVAATTTAPAAQPSVQVAAQKTVAEPATPTGSGVVPAVAAPNNLSGVWDGAYWGGGNPKTKFAVNIAWRSSGDFRGVVAEDDNIGRIMEVSAGDSERGSTIKGNISKDGEVQFTKEYDCTNDVCHQVTYEGMLDEVGRNITGTWRIDSLHGEFQMSRR